MAVARTSVRLTIPVLLLPNVNQQIKVNLSALVLKATLVTLTSSVSLQGALKTQSAQVISSVSTSSVRTPVCRRNALPTLSVASQIT